MVLQFLLIFIIYTFVDFFPTCSQSIIFHWQGWKPACVKLWWLFIKNTVFNYCLLILNPFDLNWNLPPLRWFTYWMPDTWNRVQSWCGMLSFRWFWKFSNVHDFNLFLVKNEEKTLEWKLTDFIVHPKESPAEKSI